MEQENVPAMAAPSSGHADRAVGVALFVVIGISLIGAILFVTVFGALMSPFFTGPQALMVPPGIPGSASTSQTPSAAALGVVLVGFALFFVLLAVAAGIFGSQKWAFQTAIVIFAPVCLAGGGVMGLSILVIAYSVLRLNAKLGPAPT